MGYLLTLRDLIIKRLKLLAKEINEKDGISGPQYREDGD